MILKKYDGDLSSVDFLDMMMIDISGNMRHVSIAKSYITDNIFEEGIGFDASNLGFAKVTKSDMVAIPDMNKAFVEEKDGFKILHVFCDVVDPFDNERSFEHYPRNVIKNTVKYLNELGIADTAKLLVELEFHVFDEVRYSSAHNHSYYSLNSSEGIGESFGSLPRMPHDSGYHKLYPEEKYFTYRNTIVSILEGLGIPIKYHHHEVGIAQLEIEVNFMDLEEVADNISIAKWVIKQVANEMNLYVTFMPKPIYKMPGNGMHVHQFLVKDGKSLFVGDKEHGLSDIGLNYICGILDHALSGSLLAFTNPSTNSYKRLVPGFEAPISATYAKGSRSAAIRVPGYLKKNAVRIEYRTGDATSNFYYSFAAMVLAGVDGILNKLDPKERGYNSTDNMEDKIFPLDLDAVLNGLKQDHKYLEKVFPESLIEEWIKIKRKEANYVYNAPTPQEYELYF
ncbi:glutamine synthetase family protein [Geotoga petraea]|jgi:glutamine synthetase|uniref:Glutamine synthetase n=1 Tax=Geotoga petraea TaxID=28234 RepID=A0A1G6JUZ5_9BACT|nr:glutamine synthetase beta-grasp domain-containing protein [Geotoga petraea]MDK2945690.1 glutamine synthetase [Geotoga sp.]TGG88330.1 glutamine synthetase [Geotoga petraea]SDC22599.1 glutamine synthetase [Geotoga petraea]